MTALRDLTTLRHFSESEPVKTEDVAVALQALRRASFLTPAEFAEKAGLSLAQVGLAESGHKLPSPSVVEGYLDAADADVFDRRLVLELCTRVRVGRPVVRPRPDTASWPNPATLRDEIAFRDALATIKDTTGYSYALLAKVAHVLGYPLPRTTLHNLCSKAKLPANRNTVVAFVIVCGGDKDIAESWGGAWQRLRTAQAKSDWVTALGDGERCGYGHEPDVVRADDVREELKPARPTEPRVRGTAPIPRTWLLSLMTVWSAMGLVGSTIAMVLGLGLFGLGVLVGLVAH